MRKRGLSAEQVGDGITRMLAGGRPESKLSKEARVAKAKKDFRFFCRYYLAQHFQSEPAEFHAEMGGLLRSHDRVACAAPREHAKSTVVSFAYVLFVMLFGLHHFVVIFRDGEETARQNVDDVRRELEENERIIEDFGDQIGSRKWTESEFITASGVKLIARGRGSSVRGLRFKQYRPGLVILDDIEDDQAVESKVQRDKLDRWFRRSVSNIVGPDGKLFIIGTILHHDSWLKRILDREDGVYVTRIWRAIEYTAAGKPELLWPAQWPLARLEQKKKEIGSRAFEGEFRNNPANEEDQLFSPNWWKYYSDDDLSGKQLDVAASIDVAIGTKAKNDETANVVVGQHDGRYYVLKVTMKKLRVNQQVQLVCETYREFPQIVKYGFELIAYQTALKQLVEDESRRSNLQIPAVGVEDISTDKVRRISRLIPLAEQGLLMWPSASSSFWSRDMVRCREQFEALGCSADSHDDGPDALERAISLLRGKSARRGSVKLL